MGLNEMPRARREDHEQIDLGLDDDRLIADIEDRSSTALAARVDVVDAGPREIFAMSMAPVARARRVDDRPAANLDDGQVLLDLAL